MCPTDDIVDIAQGMAYDTATLLEDVARRRPEQAVHLRNLAHVLRQTADSFDADPSTNPPTGGERASEASEGAAVQSKR